MSREGVVGFVKRTRLYLVADDLTVEQIPPYYSLSGLKHLNFPLDDIEVKVISIGEVEALSLLGASLTSKFTLTGGLEDFLNVPQQESTLTSKSWLTL
ncbi:hypothetical protein TSUD_263160 [Trifolium subterraneum]|nr:hypothetical protein TSUD_263160 [Trifolium subterraneum]